MRVRTVYFKVPDMDQAVSFWQSFFDQAPPKRSQYWSEFKCDNINFGLLWMEDFGTQKDKSNFVPVFEFKDDQLETVKARALAHGASVVVDIKDHPDKKSYVLADIFGNEFEIRRFHD